MISEALRSRFWREAEERHAYAVLDGAQNPQLLDLLMVQGGPKYECLFAGELEPDMAEVAPYLVELEPGSAFADALLGKGWLPNAGILVVSAEPLQRLWRQLRQHVMVYGPELEPLYFRFYDPRVLRVFLPSCEGKSLADFFGLVAFYFSEGEGKGPAQAWSVADGQLVREDIGAA